MANATWTVQRTDVQSFSAFLCLSACLSIGMVVWLAFSGAGTIRLDHWLGRTRRGTAQRREGETAIHLCTRLSTFTIALGESLPVALLRVRARALRVNHGEHGVPLGSHGSRLWHRAPSSRPPCSLRAGVMIRSIEGSDFHQTTRVPATFCKYD